jgi:hypothetical protein
MHSQLSEKGSVDSPNDRLSVPQKCYGNAIERREMDEIDRPWRARRQRAMSLEKYDNSQSHTIEWINTPTRTSRGDQVFPRSAFAVCLLAHESSLSSAQSLNPRGTSTTTRESTAATPNRPRRTYTCPGYRSRNFPRMNASTSFCPHPITGTISHPHCIFGERGREGTRG